MCARACVRIPGRHLSLCTIFPALMIIFSPLLGFRSKVSLQNSMCVGGDWLMGVPCLPGHAGSGAGCAVRRRWSLPGGALPLWLIWLLSVLSTSWLARVEHLFLCYVLLPAANLFLPWSQLTDRNSVGWIFCLSNRKVTKVPHYV